MGCLTVLFVMPLQILVTVLWVFRVAVNTEFLSTILAVQVILLWFRLQYFSRCSAHPLRPHVPNVPMPAFTLLSC